MYLFLKNIFPTFVKSNDMNLRRHSESTLRWTTATGMAALGLAAAYIMLHFSNYLYKFHATSLFQDTGDWFAAHFEKPAALLLYAGRFLTQFCCYPVVAVLLLTVLYAAITWLTGRYFLRGSRLPFLAVLPALALYVSLMRIGYGVLVFRADALIFTEPLGILSALLLWRLLDSLPSGSGWPYAAVPMAALLGYPLLGCYALLALLIHAAGTLTHGTGQMRWLLPLEDLACLLAVPALEYALFYRHSVWNYLWFQGAPFLDYIGAPLEWIPLAAAAALPVIFALLRSKERPVRLWQSAATLAFCAGAVVCVYLLPYRDGLFHRQMAAERAIERGDWNKVAERTCPLQVTNEVLVAYRNCALFAQGRLEESCTNYSFHTIPIVVGNREYSSSIVAGPTIFFYSGLLNFSARISSEISLYANYATERWKYLAKVALFNGERELALKYLETLSHTTLQKGWARKYRYLLDHPERLAEDPEYKLLMPLQDYEETRWMPSDNAAANVILFYQYVPGRSPEMQQWNRAAEKMAAR